MKTITSLVAALMALVVIAGAQDQTTTVRAGLLIDGTGETRRDARISIENGVVARIDGLRGAVTHDLSNHVLMPGWIDTHVQLASHFGPDGTAHQQADETEGQAMLHAVANAYRTLMAGFTTVQSLGDPLDADLRDAIARGDLPGPRILTSLSPLTALSGEPDSIRQRVRELAADGADVVMVMASASALDGGERAMSDEQIEAACQEASAQGLRAAVHASSPEVIRAAILAGCSTIKDGNRRDDDVIALLADHGTYLDPQLGLFYDNYFDNRDRYFGSGSFTAIGFARLEEARRAALEAFRGTRANDAVRIVFGTGAVAGAHGRNAEEIISRVEDGRQNAMAAIVSATSVAAAAIGRANDIGTVAPGFQADLVAVKGNPLETITAVRNVEFVMKGGHIYRNEVQAPSSSRPRRGRRRP